MFRNCLAAAYRSAFRDWFYALLNVAGLALAFAAAVLIWLFASDELSFNHFLPGYRDAYRVELTIADSGQRPQTWTATPDGLAAELKQEFPEIVGAARTRAQSIGLRRGDVESVENVKWADRDFFAVLPYPLLRGDPATALAVPDSIVLTRRLAVKYFGSVDCLGQLVDVDHVHPMRVTGVAEDVPSNATETFSALLSGTTSWGLLAIGDASPPARGELRLAGATFVRLRSQIDPRALAPRLQDFVPKHYPDPDGPTPLFQSLFLHSMADVHLHPFNPDTSEPDDRERALYAIAATGVFILLLAGINFVNLATARAACRAREVGIRKAAGASRGQVIGQFLGEAIGYALVGLVLGLGLAAMWLPSLDAFLGRQIEFDFWRRPELLVAPIAASLLMGAGAGAYPAILLSRSSPARVLKDASAGSAANGRLRQALVVVQFAVTIALLITTLVIHRQIEFATSRALHFDADRMLTIDLTGLPEQNTPDGLGRREAGPVEALRVRLAAIQGVHEMAASFVAPMWSNSLRTDFIRPGQNSAQAVNAAVQPVDYGYFGAYRIPLLAGRDFSRDFADDREAADDKSRLSGAIINQTALRAFGFADAAQAIGSELQTTDPGYPRHHRIIAVAPDFPLDSIREPVPPSVFVVDPDLFKVLSLRLGGGGLEEVLRAIDSAWLEVAPGRRISRMFLDERIAGLYKDLAQQRDLFTAFAGFAIAIGCLGLIGLSAYVADRRTKEFGIRKAMGASAFEIARLLILQFLGPVLLANALAWPVAWWFMRRWLETFAYRIDLDPILFLSAGCAAAAIAVFTTGFHAAKLARSSPALALRYE
jgi:putative ABC transport system permease protein